MNLRNIALGAALLFSTLAVPGYSATMLALSGNETGGTVTVTSGVVTGLSSIPYNFLIVVGGGVHPDLAGLLNLTGNVLELDGDVPSLGITSSPIALVDITLANPLVNTGDSTTLNISFPFTTGITISSTLLADLGITGPVTSTLVSGGLIGAGSDGSYDVSSDTMLINIATPEPGSFLLLGISLAGIALLARKRLFQLQ